MPNELKRIFKEEVPIKPTHTMAEIDLKKTVEIVLYSDVMWNIFIQVIQPLPLVERFDYAFTMFIIMATSAIVLQLLRFTIIDGYYSTVAVAHRELIKLEDTFQNLFPDQHEKATMYLTDKNWLK